MRLVRFSIDRGYTLVEVLATVAVLGLLLFAVGTAVTRVLDAEMLGAGRQSVGRSADDLAARLSEEARSSTAVFVPSIDVLGQPNTGVDAGHEVDFFRKSSSGDLTFVAYRFDRSSNSVTRYEYGSGPVARIFNSDLVADHVSSVTASKTTAGAIGGVIGGPGKPVNIYYGSPDLVGGNVIVTVAIDAGGAGIPVHHLDVHLSSHAAPTDISILVPSGVPPPSPSPNPSPIIVGFLLTSPNVHPPHGPNGQGDPGSDNGGHGPNGIPGTAVFLGNGSGATADWLSLHDVFATIQDGAYTFKDSSGREITVSISCNSGPCPPFVPLPVATASPGVVFHTTT